MFSRASILSDPSGARSSATECLTADLPQGPLYDHFSVALVCSLWVASSTFHCCVYFSNFTQFMGSSFQVGLCETAFTHVSFLLLKLKVFLKFKSQPLSLKFKVFSQQRNTFSCLPLTEQAANQQTCKQRLLWGSHSLHLCFICFIYSKVSEENTL